MSKGYPSMTALLALVAVAGYQNKDKLAQLFGGSTPQSAGQGDQGGAVGNLPASVKADAVQAAGAGGVGGLLSNGIRELVQQFQQHGHGEEAKSWVSQGPNQKIESGELEEAIGTDVLAQLSQRTGLPRQEVLSRLAQHLPMAVDKYTPEGQVPA